MYRMREDGYLTTGTADFGQQAQLPPTFITSPASFSSTSGEQDTHVAVRGTLGASFTWSWSRYTLARSSASYPTLL